MEYLEAHFQSSANFTWFISNIFYKVSTPLWLFRVEILQNFASFCMEYACKFLANSEYSFCKLGNLDAELPESIYKYWSYFLTCTYLNKQCGVMRESATINILRLDIKKIAVEKMIVILRLRL